MRQYLLIFLILLIIPISLSQDCNTKCIDAGHSSGICADSCSKIDVGGADDCLKQGEAALVIGTDAIETYATGNKFIGENKTDPNWIWIIKNIRTAAATDINNEDDDTQHSGPIIGIKNDFIATDIDSIDIKAIGVGDSFCFPKDIICISFNKLTVSEYGTFVIQKSTVDLSSFNTSWTNKNTILIQSVDDADGLTVQTSGYDSPVSAAHGVTTDKMWVVYNSTSSYAGIFYEDSSNARALAGYINLNNAADDHNIADVNYKKTQDTNIQIDLRGDFGTQDNLDIVLDILGEKGDASTDSSDDITVNLRHNSNADITGFGSTASTAEETDLVWTSTSIGKKDEDHRSLYGIIIKDPNTNNAQDKFEFEVPADQVKAEINITRKVSRIVTSEEGETTVEGEQLPSPILSSELKFKEDFNLIFVGGPCANPDLSQFPEFPTCSNWPLMEGEAMIKYTKNKNNIALLVAGTTANDTLMAAKFLKYFEEYNNLEGTYIIIRDNKPEVVISSAEGIDFSDYPLPFVEDDKPGKMRLVVGDKAKAEDTVGAEDIVSGLFSQIRRVSLDVLLTQSTNQSTDSVVREIPLGNSIGDTTFFNKGLTNADIKTLINSDIDFAGNKINYKEEVMLYNAGPTVSTSLSSSDDTYKSDVYLEATAGSLRYYYAFKEKIDISTATANQPLTISMLDNLLSITEAVSATSFKSQSATEYYLKPGNSVTVDNKEVVLKDIDKNSAVIVEVNDNMTIIPEGRNIHIDGLQIKNSISFDIEGSSCCCTNLLDF